MLREQLAKLQSELRNPTRTQSNSSNILENSGGTTDQHQLPSPSRLTPTKSSLIRGFGSSTPSLGSAAALIDPPSASPSSRRSRPSSRRQSSRNKSSSSLTSITSEGLSIRFISGSASSTHNSHSHNRHHSTSNGVNPTPHPTSASALALALASPNQLPTSDSGYIRDSNGVWVPISSENPIINGTAPHEASQHQHRHHSLNSNSNKQQQQQQPTPSSSSSPPPPAASPHSSITRSPHQARSLSRIPISAVALGRVLAGDTSPASPLSQHASPILPAMLEGQPERTAEEEEANEDQFDEHSPIVRPPRPRKRGTHSAIESISRASDGLESGQASPSWDGGSELSGGDHTGSVGMVSRPSRTNPFFSSGGGRDRGAMIQSQHQGANGSSGQGGRHSTGSGNTGKVITSLQSDLLYARTALDQSKSQLRLSQRAVESLNRQTEDLKESMTRLRLENEGLSKMLNRKERTVSELMERIKKSESETNQLKLEKKEYESKNKKLVKDSDEIVKDSLRKKDRAESQYEAMRGGLKSLTDGFRTEINGLQEQIVQLEKQHKKELDTSRLKFNTLVKLHSGKTSTMNQLENEIKEMREMRETGLKKWIEEIQTLKETINTRNSTDLDQSEKVTEVVNEFKRFRKILREHSQSSAT